MRTFWHPSLYSGASLKKRGFTVLLLFAMLIQAQPLLACEMSGHTMPTDACCCDDAMRSDAPLASPAPSNSDCCKLQTELTLKSGLDQARPTIVPKPLNDELSDILSLMPLLTLQADSLRSGINPTSNPPSTVIPHHGTKTYLHTQRLRI